jgi:hypothetical protein
VYAKRLLRHLCRSSQDYIFVEGIGSSAALGPEDWHRSARLNKAVQQVADLKYLLSLAKVAYISIVINPPNVKSCSRSQVLPPGNKQILYVEVSEIFIHECNMALDNWSVPSEAHVIFLESLQDIHVPKVP